MWLSDPWATKWGVGEEEQKQSFKTLPRLFHNVLEDPTLNCFCALLITSLLEHSLLFIVRTLVSPSDLVPWSGSPRPAILFLFCFAFTWISPFRASNHQM